MRVDGKWLLGGDGIVRPVFESGVLAADGSWVSAKFLLDTGADRTIFHAVVLAQLGLPTRSYPGSIAGVGGATRPVIVDTELRLPLDQGGVFGVKWPFLALTDPAAMDMSLLGRDILDLFAVIVDRPGNVVCLLAQHHQYRIESPGP